MDEDELDFDKLDYFHGLDDDDEDDYKNENENNKNG